MRISCFLHVYVFNSTAYNVCTEQLILIRCMLEKFDCVLTFVFYLMLTIDGTILFNMFFVINMLKQFSPQFFFNSILNLRCMQMGIFMWVRMKKQYHHDTRNSNP